MKVSEFVFAYVDKSHHQCQKISLNRGGFYIDSPGWYKKDTINPKNDDDDDDDDDDVCFKYMSQSH